jgi:hypothetical protein
MRQPTTNRACHLLLLTAHASSCVTDPHEVTPPSRETATEMNPSVREVHLPQPAFSASAAPSLSVSAASQRTSLEGATTLVYRYVETGAISPRNTVVTRTLQRSESEALLTVETSITRNEMGPLRESLGPLGTPTVRRFAGTVKTEGKLSIFELEDGGEAMRLECEMGVLRVAGATAVRERVGLGGCNGDRGRWIPDATKRVPALRCGIDRDPPDPNYEPDRREQMAFVASPGIEFLWVNDDCSMQGGGYRFVPTDRSVHPFRRPGAR